jgi:hypothetical protein
MVAASRRAAVLLGEIAGSVGDFGLGLDQWCRLHVTTVRG